MQTAAQLLPGEGHWEEAVTDTINSIPEEGAPLSHHIKEGVAVLIFSCWVFVFAVSLKNCQCCKIQL